MKPRQIILLLCCGLLAACAPRETNVERGNRLQILHKGNGQEPEELDPHVVNGISEQNIITALLEGLVSEDPKTLAPVPGVAERWTMSEDALTYTFPLRKNARWSSGAPVRASDFVYSYRRLLSPRLGGPYAYMLYVMKNARAYHEGTIKDFDEVGVKAADDQTLVITLEAPTPYFLSLLNHWTWFPVHPPTIEQHGGMTDRGSQWTRPENFVGNGPFNLADWQVDRFIRVKKSPTYWDAANVKLNEIFFYPIGQPSGEERDFRAGRIHLTYQLPLNKINRYRDEQSGLLRIDPYLETYFYCLNVSRPPLDDVRVRQALSLSLDRESLVKHVLHGTKEPALHFTPPDTAGYTARARMHPDLDKAKALLADAGYPNGQGFPKLDLLYNTSDNHRTIAEAIQQMWKDALGIEIGLINQEWKVYINARRQHDFDLCRFGWTGDYNDPNTFLDMWVTGGGNNAAAWSNKRYDELVRRAATERDPQQRFEWFQQAEEILIAEAPVIPIYFGRTVYLARPEVRNWHPTVLDRHPYKYVYLE